MYFFDSKRRQKYSLVQGDQPSLHFKRQPHGFDKCNYALCCVAFIFWTLIVASATFYGVRATYHPEPKFFQELGCGTSVDEAIALRCTWDNLTNSWLPSACSNDAAPETAMWNAKAWNFYADSTGRQPILDLPSLAIPVAFPGPQIEGQLYYASDRHHLTHCAYTLSRAGRLLAEGGPKDWIVANPKHTKHCADLLLSRALKAPGVDDITAIGHAFLGTCRIE